MPSDDLRFRTMILAFTLGIRLARMAGVNADEADKIVAWLWTRPESMPNEGAVPGRSKGVPR